MCILLNFSRVTVLVTNESRHLISMKDYWPLLKSVSTQPRVYCLLTRRKPGSERCLCILIDWNVKAYEYLYIQVTCFLSISTWSAKNENNGCIFIHYRLVSWTHLTRLDRNIIKNDWLMIFSDISISVSFDNIITCFLSITMEASSYSL